MSKTSPAAVSDSTIHAFVEQHGFYKYYPTSALDGTNVHTAIDDLVGEIIRRLRLPPIDTTPISDHGPAPKNTIKLTENAPPANDSSSCC